MKPLSTITALLTLIACSAENRITPEKLISVEYGVYTGFTGWITTLTVYPQKQVLQPSYRSAKSCELPISAAEWQELTRLFNEDAFKKVKVGEERVCPDAGSSWIIARSAQGEIKAHWGPCTGGDPTGIQPLIKVLDERLKVQQATCQ